MYKIMTGFTGICNPQLLVMSSDLLVFVGNHVLLPGSESPIPATIEVSKLTGKITGIHGQRRGKDSYPNVDFAHWVDAGEQFILPGLVEYVFNSSSYVHGDDLSVARMFI